MGKANPVQMARIRQVVAKLIVSDGRTPPPGWLAGADPALALLDRMIDQGAAFEVMDGQLLWFGPASTVTSAIRAEVARLKPDIIGLLNSFHPRSRRQWGNPTLQNWAEHPETTEDPE